MGVEPLTHKSFTVPQILSFPISPPLKNRGSTTKLSVVTAIFPLIISNIAESPCSFNISLLKYLRNTFFINLYVSSPPLPWANVITSIAPPNIKLQNNSNMHIIKLVTLFYVKLISYNSFVLYTIPQLPSLDTMHGPIGVLGVHIFPKALQSIGLFIPLNISPQIH